ncbi:ABC transporter permease subunit [Haloarcula nitratireducens]|uniref:Urea ABC transporter permease n=1 Tax=Haloarcula nitratireducens TaxID=2487749 RepID=A0AAW4PCE4_9EURY|nr:urea ABC transporter permease [Halomicroarcula nitratireducens]MBX0295243.1 urea ABC transporter permease [Halomicroarcula nitratireducens]
MADDHALSGLGKRFEGPNTVGSGRGFWAALAVAAAVLFAYPSLTGIYQATQLSRYLVAAFLALSLAFVWGYAGILSFGQNAFYGLAAYAFAVTVGNLASPLGTTTAVFVAVGFGALASLVLGYFMFYGGVRDVYVTITTLVVTVVLNTYGTTASQVFVGSVNLGGDTGIGITDVVLGAGPVTVDLVQPLTYYVIAGLLVATYLGLRVFVNSDFGRVMVAIREDEDRAEMFGYDVKFRKLVVFTIGGGLAGLGGVLYMFQSYSVTPETVFSAAAAALPVVWVSVGGRKTLLGPIVAAVATEWVRTAAAVQFPEVARIGVGLLMIVSILLLPEGVVPGVRGVYRYFGRHGLRGGSRRATERARRALGRTLRGRLPGTENAREVARE